MTAQLSPTPVFRAQDNNNRPLFGGQLFTYAAGTTTPQATYVDSTQTTQNTNPVILNSRGECNLWLDPTLSYKFILEDSSGNQIWSVDNIQGQLGVSGNIIPSADNQFNIGSASFRFANGYFGTQIYIGPNDVPILNGGTVGYWPQTAAESAAAVTPTNYAIPSHIAVGIILAARYGATTSDATGAINTTAIQNAFAVANQISGGAMVVLGSGNFKINALLTGYSNTYLVGQGKGMGNNAVTAGTSITQLSASADVIDFPNASSCGLRDIALIVGSGGNGVIWSATSASQCYYFELENVAVDLTANSAAIGIWMNPVGTQADVYFSRMRNVTVTGGSGNTWGTKVGIRLGNSASTFPLVYGDFAQLLITNVNIGLDLQGIQNSVFHGVTLYNISGAGSSGIGIKGTGTSSYNYIYGLMMEDGTIDTFINWASGCFDNCIFVTQDVTNMLTKYTDSNGSNQTFGDSGTSGFLNKFGPALNLYSVRSLTVGDNQTPGGVAMKLYYATTTTVNPGAIAAGSTAEVTVSVSGMVATDQVIASGQSGAEAGIMWVAYAVSGGYRIRLANVTNASITPVSRTYNVTVFR